MYLTINSLGDLVNLIRMLKEAGFLKDVTAMDVVSAFEKKDFPLQLPVNVEALLGVLKNPIVGRVFGKKIDLKAKEIWQKAIEAG